MLTLADVLEALTNERPSQATHVITEAVIDSRRAIPGSMFIALPGEKADGHDFVGAAFEQSACLALVDRDLSADFRILDLREGLSAGGRQLESPAGDRMQLAPKIDETQGRRHHWECGQIDDQGNDRGSTQPPLPDFEERRQLQQ
jgi:UDP-N-acetylmuramoyl-tripeptide--D-alanyl-D-alanine ligase